MSIRNPQNTLKTLLKILIGWTLLLIMLGAYVRLSDAGLGCPDWPGCYGKLTVPNEAHEIHAATQAYGGTVDGSRAWKEMIHRYVAGLYVLTIMGMSWLAWRSKTLPRLLVLAPPVLVLLQAAFGMWTVTLKLMPIVVTGHLLGGLSMLATLMFMHTMLSRADASIRLGTNWRRLGWGVLLATLLQLFLGGWVSTNYAGLACNGFPACQGQFTPPAGMAEAMYPLRQLGETAAGVSLSVTHLAAIHWLHRLGALVLLLTGVCWVIGLLKHRLALPAGLLIGALGVQLTLGIANVVWSMPLALAVAHTGGAAVLLSTVVAVLGWSYGKRY